ncbi:hypothetical protein OVA24_12180 [Luteolibacter sp. SL250]|uniref:DUF4129 domain-containing protein n=1 Tax=Luteolibacter sp. SL250 TaxID=2995170 RepID=UPI002271A3E1|nr:DUF4129 domain-containing protein [Luteolibacter sp. SL250]WAC17996.1 hypothetical protein OVA24_12180 [Luteolibacter sp. SL250]
MRLEDVTAEIRPRSDWEAVDLGFAMIRRDFWRCFTVWWLALLAPVLIAGWFLREMPLVLAALFWWWKPVGSRMVLFDLSRRLFGEKPGWKAVFREIPRAWIRRFFYRMIFARFSPWLPVTLAVEDLEGLRGKPYRQRAKQLARRGDGVVMWLYFAADLTAAWLALSVFAIVIMMMPEGESGPWQAALESFDQSNPFDIPLVISWTAAGCAMLGMALVDIFVTGAGFGVYVNNRTWLEGWDVELAFKRLGQRLGKLAAVLVLAASLFFPLSSHAQETGPDPEIIREVKSHEDFKVHSETYKVPVSKSKSSSSSGGFGAVPAYVALIFGYTALAALLGFLIWVIWNNRHAFRLAYSGGGALKEAPSARMVMGMEVTAESLPKDIPTAAWALWTAGRRHEALALLYRGTISKVIDVARVEIQESDTEGDCLRRVEDAGSSAHPDYFKGLTGAWMRLAYAAQDPPEMEVRALCESWPFREGRVG